MVKWNTNNKDSKLIVEIADRASRVGMTISKKSVEMDISAAHLNGNRLDLKKLLGFDNFNFCHDVAQINKNICHDTGKLLNCFLPRSTLPPMGTRNSYARMNLIKFNKKKYRAGPAYEFMQGLQDAMSRREFVFHFGGF